MMTATFDETKWQLVPVEPSIAMCIHGAEKVAGSDGRSMAEVYRAMLHAAPVPPVATPAASTIGAAQTAEQVWDQALENAANLTVNIVMVSPANREAYNGAMHAVEAYRNTIRALKRPTPTHNSEAGDADQT